MNTKRVNAAADVIHRAMQQGKTLPVSLATALDATCMLQSPESAAEARQLQDDVTGACLARYEEEQENARLRLAWKSARERAEVYGKAIQRHVADRDTWKGWAKEAQAQVQRLLAERHSTNEALSDAAEQLRVQRDRIAELEAAAEKVRHLHTDSPMGVCPTCIDGDALAAGGDGLVPYPCPTARLAGATDWDPCHPCGCPKRFDRHAWGCPTLPADDVPLLHQPEDPHTGPLHHDYALGRDLPFIPQQKDGEAL